MKRILKQFLNITASSDKVFGLIEDPKARKQWQKGLEETTYTHVPEGDSPVGTRFVAHIREGRRLREYPGEVVAYEPGTLISVQMDVPQFTLTNTYMVIPKGESSQVEFVALVVFRSPLAKVMSPLASLMLGSIMKRQLHALKALAESDS